MSRAGVATTDGQGEEAYNVRTSQNTFLARGADARIEGLERRVHALTRTW